MSLINKKIIINGTFDGLHSGHRALFEYASSLGPLTVAIDSTRRLKELKGPGRPFFELSYRLRCIAETGFVHDMHIFDSDEELIALIKQHDVMVKGSEYKNKPIIGSDLIEVVFFDEIVDTFGQKISSSTMYKGFGSR